MYSRYHDRALRVPDNYGGTAFSEALPLKEPPPRRLDVAKPTPPPVADAEETPTASPPSRPPTPPHPPIPSPASSDAPPPVPAEPKKETRDQASAPLPLQGLLANLGHAFPFSHGLGFDELLLLGLILLLSQSGEGSDLVLWLTLLLFCG